MRSVRICLYTHQPMHVDLSTAGSYVVELLLVSLSRAERYWVPHALRVELHRSERATYPLIAGRAPTQAEARAAAVLRLLDRSYRACVLHDA